MKRQHICNHKIPKFGTPAPKHIQKKPAYAQRAIEARHAKRRQVLPGFPVKEPFSTLEQMKEYLRGDRITCLLCGKPYKALGGHLSAVHGMSADDYKAKYGLPFTFGLCGESVSDALRDVRFADKPEVKAARIAKLTSPEIQASSRSIKQRKSRFRELNSRRLGHQNAGRPPSNPTTLTREQTLRLLADFEISCKTLAEFSTEHRMSQCRLKRASDRYGLGDRYSAVMTQAWRGERRSETMKRIRAEDADWFHKPMTAERAASLKRVRDRRRKVKEGYPRQAPLSSLDQINAYLDQDEKECLLCGYVKKNFGAHLAKIHATNLDAYRELYGLPYTKPVCAKETSEKLNSVRSEDSETVINRRMRNLVSARTKCIESARTGRMSLAKKLAALKTISAVNERNKTA
jgi:predicted transcriptional regulator